MTSLKLFFRLERKKNETTKRRFCCRFQKLFPSLDPCTPIVQGNIIRLITTVEYKSKTYDVSDQIIYNYTELNMDKITATINSTVKKV